MKIIAGLGNPGSRYQWTRHNAGFMVLDRLSHVAGISCQKKIFSGLGGEGFWQGERVLLLKPQTYMNLSGRSIAEAVRFHKLTPRDLMVIHDDLDFPLGRVKLKCDGGHGGHNGLRSIVADLGTKDFYRVRIGIGRPAHGDAADYVLSPFSRSEMDNLLPVLDGAVDALAHLLTDGLAKAMSLYNNKDFLDSDS